MQGKKVKSQRLKVKSQKSKIKKKAALKDSLYSKDMNEITSLISSSLLTSDFRLPAYRNKLRLQVLKR